MAKLAEIKTKENEASVDDFIKAVNDGEKRKDSFTLVKLMQTATKEKPKMWGTSLIGFGSRIYKSPATGREVAWFKIGFSPRKANLSLHLILDLKKHSETLKKLGKHKAGAGCIYISKLSDVDVKILDQLIKEAAKMK